MRKISVDTRLAIAMAGYVGYIAFVSVLFGSLHYRPSGLIGALVALPAAVAVGFAVVGQIVRVQGREGVERHVQLESLGAAFVLTMLGAVTYGLLEAFAAVPRLSAWWVWGYGMGSWAVISMLLRRRYG